MSLVCHPPAVWVQLACSCAAGLVQPAGWPQIHCTCGNPTPARTQLRSTIKMLPSPLSCSVCVCCGCISLAVCLSWLSRARFLSLAPSELRLCSANHRPGYFSNLACDWLSIVWAYSEQETENGPWCCWLYGAADALGMTPLGVPAVVTMVRTWVLLEWSTRCEEPVPGNLVWGTSTR